jgi:hypothetical protein
VTPSPDKLRSFGAALSLVSNLNVALRGPVVLGVNSIWKVNFSPSGIGVGSAKPTTSNSGSLVVMLLTVTSPPVPFVNVTLTR